MITFPLKLGESYYNKGFFNFPVAVDDSIGADGEILTIILDPYSISIETFITRTANTNGTARIIPRTLLRDWFQDNFEQGDIVEVEIKSPHLVHIRKR